MNRIGLLLLFLQCVGPVLAQRPFTLTDEAWMEVTDFHILEDQNYPLERIVSDSTLPFRPTDTMWSDRADAYWVRVHVYNPHAYAAKYMAGIFPLLDNTLYYYDYDRQEWVSNQNGYLVPSRQRHNRRLPCVLQGKTTNVLYFYTKIATLREFGHPIVPSVLLYNAQIFEATEQTLWVSTLVTTLIVLMFFGYNAYVYYVFRDKTYLYYLIMQIGGMLYIISFNKYINVLIKPKFNVLLYTADGLQWTYDLNIIVNRFAIVLILGGMIQLARVYLDTKALLPRQDKLLKYLLVVFIWFQGIVFVVMISRIAYIDHLVTPWFNVLVVAIVLAILYTALVSYRRKYPAARYFLLANLVSLAMILALGVFFIRFPTKAGGSIFQTANIALIAQAFCLALALVERFMLLRDELKRKQLEAQELHHQNEKIASENLLHKIQNDLLQEKLDSNQRELASTTLYMYQKNELLSGLKSHVHTLRNTAPTSVKNVIQDLESVIRNNLYLDADWERFRVHFERVHPNFFKQLLAEHPSLTQNEVRLCAYFHLNLSTKEIAALLNIDPASVRKAKMRLNKKMNTVQI